MTAYWCFKHKRECKPIDRADHFVRRYTLDTLTRLKAFARVRSAKDVSVLHGDARELELPEPLWRRKRVVEETAWWSWWTRPQTCQSTLPRART